MFNGRLAFNGKSCIIAIHRYTVQPIRNSINLYETYSLYEVV